MTSDISLLPFKGTHNLQTTKLNLANTEHNMVTLFGARHGALMWNAEYFLEGDQNCNVLPYFGCCSRITIYFLQDIHH